MNHSRRGLTLVETLVLIGLLVIVAGLLLPAIDGHRTPSRWRKCQNNLRQISAGIISFEETQGRFPGARELIAESPTGPGRNKAVPWTVTVLPYLDQQPLFEIWNDPKQSVYQNATQQTGPFVEKLIPSLPIYRCPSDELTAASPQELRGHPPENSYVVNGGALPTRALDPLSRHASVDDYLQVMNGNNGVFHDLVRKPNARFRYEMLHDGAGNTVMMSENSQAQWWCISGDVDEFGIRLPYRNRLATAFYFHYTKAPQVSPGQPEPRLEITTAMRINGDMKSSLRPSTARPSSFHMSGVNMAFCDRSVKFIHQNIDYHVYTALMTPHDRRADVPWREFILKAEDYLDD